MTHFSYDIFLSHNRADKDFVRQLANELSGINYNGRLLRPWLDEQFLEAGQLGNNSELTSAMDQSRILVLVLSPESLQSEWVKFEFQYFLRTREAESVVLLLHKNCELPREFTDIKIIDCTENNDHAIQLLISKTCPGIDYDISRIKNTTEAAFEFMHENNKGGFSPGPANEYDHFFNTLMKFNINDAAYEGLALQTFTTAANKLYLLDNNDDKSYNCKMLLGECLGAAVYQSDTYRLVIQEYLDIAETHTENTRLLFVLGRAFSKLADLNVSNIDISVMLRIAAQLDSKQDISNENMALLQLFGRVIGKIRGTQVGMLLIKALSVSGVCSRIIATIAISITHIDADPVFYTSQLQQCYTEQAENGIAAALEIPSKQLLGLLYDMRDFINPVLDRRIEMAQYDLQKAYPVLNFPYYCSVFYGRPGIIAATYRYNAPFAGMVMLATLDNMVELSMKAGSTNIVCLTEPRIVDALFNRAGAIIIPEQDIESLQCRRLRSRKIPFAMVSKIMMSKLGDGDFLLINKDSVIHGGSSMINSMNKNSFF